ncbi:hypothetical protein GCM10010331_10130 [Streptomyces xanthochromogenes]|nr:hypothetical protein GCM10010331_10130 [Streptomyces xanthochromogenes]
MVAGGVGLPGSSGGGFVACGPRGPCAQFLAPLAVLVVAGGVGLPGSSGGGFVACGPRGPFAQFPAPLAVLVVARGGGKANRPAPRPVHGRGAGRNPGRGQRRNGLAYEAT